MTKRLFISFSGGGSMSIAEMIAKAQADLIRQVAEDLEAGRIKPDNMVQHLKVIADRAEGKK